MRNNNMRIALGVEYDGHEFFGWQAQKKLLTVQGSLEIALSHIANEEIKTFCAGRTDAGVHATGQVIHFETSAQRDLRAWTLGVNAKLPRAISVSWSQVVDENFHARFSALSRRYRYVICNSRTRPAISAKRATWYHYPLNIEAMNEAGKLLIGECDFTSFRSSECESRTPMRNVHYITVTRHDEFVVIEIQANAFLHHMVRNIAGVLMRIGSGLKNPQWAKEVLDARDRCRAAETASPDGLYLCHVEYSQIYQLPTTDKKILLL